MMATAQQLLLGLVEAMRIELDDPRIVTRAGWIETIAPLSVPISKEIRERLVAREKSDLVWGSLEGLSASTKTKRERHGAIWAGGLAKPLEENWIHPKTGKHFDMRPWTGSDPVSTGVTITEGKIEVHVGFFVPKTKDTLGVKGVVATRAMRKRLCDRFAATASSLLPPTCGDVPRETSEGGKKDWSQAKFRYTWSTDQVLAAAQSEESAEAFIDSIVDLTFSAAEVQRQVVPDMAQQLADHYTEIAWKKPMPMPEHGTIASGGVSALLAAFQENPCIILQGPPGTGKTFLAEQLIGLLSKGEDGSPVDIEQTRFAAIEGDSERAKFLPIVWEMIQLHPSYAYEDLVRGLVVDETADGIRFVSRDRLLIRLAEIAEMREDRPTLLIMDEVNRCDLASVLGELILLLEKSKRGRRARLQYPAAPREGSRDSLALPAGLWLLGTMNTADRSIALVDYAIRRRFRFIDVLPSRTSLDDYYRSTRQRAERAGSLFDAIQSLIDNPDLQVGHSYFMVDPKLDETAWAHLLAGRIIYEVLPLLREYQAEARLKDYGLHHPGLPDTINPTSPHAARSVLAAWLTS